MTGIYLKFFKRSGRGLFNFCVAIPTTILMICSLFLMMVVEASDLNQTFSMPIEHTNSYTAYVNVTDTNKMVNAQRLNNDQFDAFISLHDKLKEGKNISMITIGGSMIVGLGCLPSNSNDTASRACTYPSLFAEWLSSTYYQGLSLMNNPLFNYENRATGGTTTIAALPILPQLFDIPIDLVIIDYSVNDQGMLRNVKRRKENAEFIFAATEALLRFLLLHRPKTAIILVEGMCKDDLSSKEHQRAAKLYGVAFVPSYALLHCDKRKATPHPPQVVHKAIKMGLTVWWEKFSSLLLRNQSDGIYSNNLVVPPGSIVSDAKSRVNVCENPLAIYDAHQRSQIEAETNIDNNIINNTGLDQQLSKQLLSISPTIKLTMSPSLSLPPTPPSTSKVPKVIHGDWHVSFDMGREDKAAWIATKNGSVIEFPVTFGPSPQIVLVYTKGYDDTFGDVILSIVGDDDGSSSLISTKKNSLKIFGEPFILKGCCDINMVTQSQILILHPSPRNITNPFSVSPLAFSNTTRLRVEFVKGKYSKFAIKFLSSC